MRHPHLWLWIVLLLLLGSENLVASEDPDPDEDASWIEETLQRFFGNKALPGEQIAGEGLELVGPYVEYEGRTIEVVIVHQVKSFEEGWDEDRHSAERLLNIFSRPFQDYTQEFIIRQYLLFEAGDALVPFDLADTERLLRDLTYINDVRIHVVPINGENDKVGIVVETNDRWPLGASATILKAHNWRARLYSTNVAGLGVLFSNELLHNEESIRNWGYRGQLFKGNIDGSFWDAGMDYENSHNQRNLILGLNRSLAHPGVKYIGGVQWEDLEKFANDVSDRAFHQGDVWGGKVIKLYDRLSVHGGDRPMLVPAVRVLKRDHYKRPGVLPDSNRSFHNYTRCMVSLTWQQLKSYKTSHLYGEGEVEALHTGLVLKMTTGVEDREFETRPGLFFDSAAIAMQSRGDIFFLGFSMGSFLHEKHFSEGVMDVKTAYFTPLLGSGRIRHRVSWALRYTLGLGRYTFDQIFLDDRSGIFNLENREVAGNQRMIFSTFYRMFTPASLLGFRMSFFSFADLGVVGSENDALFKEKFYLSCGVGVRLRNPALVFPTVQLRLSMVSNVEDSGFRFGVNVGNVSGTSIRFPSSRPGTLVYQ